MNKTHLLAAVLAASLINLASAHGSVPREIYHAARKSSKPTTKAMANMK